MADIPRQPEDVETILAEDRFLRSLAWSLLGDGYEVEDAVQHTWLRSLVHPPQKPAALREFLSRILRNRILNLRRGARRRAYHEKASARPEALPSTAQMVAQEELRRRVGEAVLALEEPYRTTIWLRFREELPPREVAARMEVPVSTVRTRVRRALEQMRKRLDGDYGDRKAWSALVVPCFERAELATAAAVTVVGAMTMKKFVVASVAALLLLMAGLAGFWLLGGEETRPLESAPEGMAGILVEAHPKKPRMSLDPATVEEPAMPLRGTLIHANGRPAAGVPFWSWGELRPPWTRLPEESRFVSVALELDEPAGETDEAGHWQLAPGAIEAVTFAPSDLILVSYELEEDSDRTEGMLVWDLPPFTDSHFQVLGLRADEQWMAQLLPAIEDDSTWPAVGHQLLVLYEGNRQAFAVTLLAASMDTARRQTGIPEISLPTIPGLFYQREIVGIGFEVEPAMKYFVAPLAESISIARRGPILKVRVTEPGGVVLTQVEGRAVHWETEDHNSGYPWPVRGGRADIGWGLFPGQAHRQLRVLMDDGEQFAAEFEFEPGAAEKILRFERGQGRLPSLAVELPEDALLGDCTVVLEDDRGQFDWGKHYREQDFSGGLFGSPSEATFAERGSHTLVFTNLPDGWVQLWILTTGGRVAHLRNPGATAEVRIRWLPDTELEEFDPQEAKTAAGLGSTAAYLLELELVTTTGLARMQVVDRFQYSRDTYDWPVWRKRAPIGMRYRVRASGRVEFDVKRKVVEPGR